MNPAYLLPAAPTLQPGGWTYRIIWTRFGGRVVIFAVVGGATSDDAVKSAHELAVRNGWHPVRWYEFWRNKDFPRG